MGVQGGAEAGTEQRRKDGSYSVTFLIQARSTYLGMVLPIVRSHTHTHSESTVKTMLPDTLTGQSDGGDSSNEVPFPEEL